ncbi:hypothetical protein LCGC14_1421100 [marine sediment metagenome]|uniref:Uncharacterized protein n=1 Tax=marine sediment metagenome TaxID=412755 RepID=A0A0F9MT09_9ZZZZ
MLAIMLIFLVCLYMGVSIYRDHKQHTVFIQRQREIQDEIRQLMLNRQRAEIEKEIETENEEKQEKIKQSNLTFCSIKRKDWELLEVEDD